VILVRGPIADMEYRRLQIGRAEYLVASAGNGQPVLLLHGFPQTHYCWRGVVPALSQRYRVIAPDLRGYGATSAPPGGTQGEGFSKREMANDLVELMDALGFDHFAVVGHDRGARVAYRMALDHPVNVDRLVVVNAIPTVEQFERMGARSSLGYWPWFLLAQPAPFPEVLIAAEPEHFLRFIFDSWTAERRAIDAEAFGEYLRALRETIASICADYRASFWFDQHDDAANRRVGRRIECPVLLVTGEEEQFADAEAVWRPWAQELRATALPGGHFLPEEATEPLARVLVEFLDASRADGD
jgi:haloacetate dehalogenase